MLTTNDTLPCAFDAYMMARSKEPPRRCNNASSLHHNKNIAMTTKEAFYNDANRIFAPLGAAFVDESCQVVASDGRLVTMHGMPYLRKHPTEVNKCVFATPRHSDPNSVMMDSALSACTNDPAFLGSSSAGTKPVVANVSPEEVAGRSECVVQITPGLDPSTYATYASSARTNTLNRTPQVRARVQERAAVQGAIATIQARITRQNAEINNLRTRQRDLQRQRNEATSARDRRQTQFTSDGASLRSLEQRIVTQKQQADQFEAQLAAVQTRLRNARAQEATLNARLATANDTARTTSQTTALQQQLRSINTEINRKQTAIAATRRQIASVQRA